MTQTLLEVDRLTAGYDGPPVLREVSFAVRAGEVVALLGANGAGKTTTLRGACGLLAPRGGQIRYLGRPVASAAPQRLSRDGLVHVPEGKGLFFALTVAEHFRLLGAERRTIEEAYRYFPALEPLSRRRAGLLSGGEQQMLALACAIMRLPRVLLVDELSLGLAPVIVERLLPILRGYADEHQAGVLMVEQTPSSPSGSRTGPWCSPTAPSRSTCRREPLPPTRTCCGAATWARPRHRQLLLRNPLTRPVTLKEDGK
jgi:branched-chain amino acid transport system ATP-binding protein